MSIRTITAERAGGPEQLQPVESPEPKPETGELLVETAFTGVNFIETYQRSGVYSVQYPFTPGSEASGTVISVGEGVTDFSPGDRVATCEGRATYAERFVVPAVAAAHVPDGVALDVAAALPLQGITAHYLATSASRPREGDTVIVHAGAGGVGLLLTQLLTQRGVRVLTTVSTPEKRELSLAAGAAEVLSYETFADRARELTDGAGVTVVYDGVGKRTFDDSLRALRVRGEMVLFGGASGQVPLFDLQRLNTGGSLSITRPSIGHFLLTPEERGWRYASLFDEVLAGELDVRIGARYPLAEASAAHRALENRETTGKVILEA